jgi:hypothetical protein
MISKEEQEMQDLLLAKEIRRRCLILSLQGDDGICEDYKWLQYPELKKAYGWVLKDKDLKKTHVFRI